MKIWWGGVEECMNNFGLLISVDSVHRFRTSGGRKVWEQLANSKLPGDLLLNQCVFVCAF